MNLIQNPMFKETADGASKNTLPLRAEVDQALTWDLSKLFPDDDAWEKAFAEAQTYVEKAAAWQGKIHESGANLLAYQNFADQLGREIEKLYVYASMKGDQDTADSRYSGMNARMGQLLAKIMAAVSWFDPELASLSDDEMKKLMDEEKGLQLYAHAYELIRRSREHMLSVAEERLLARSGEVLGAPAEIFSVLDNADQRFPQIKDEDGEEIEITHGRFGKLLESRDRRVREEAFKGLYKTYQQFRNTYAQTLSSAVKSHNFTAEVRKYASARAAALFSNKIPESVYDNLLSSIDQHLDLLHRYVAVRKNLLKLEDIHSYDLYVPVVENLNLSYTIEEAEDLILNALSVLGEDYTAILRRAFSERWIDFAENQGKRSGAYSGGCYDSVPYILMTWKGTLDDVFTLAHELGHSCHSSLTRSTQPYIYGDYSIFLAEIASTTNENLLTAYMLKTVKDPATRRYVIMHYLDGFKGTVFRQTQFADFEHLIHQADQQGTALTADFLCEKYGELNRRYYGSELAFDPEISLEWARIPHFYYNYYVYQYATGFSAASAFAARILGGEKADIEAYLGYLKAGSSDYPIEVLKKAGLDMTTPRPVEDALAQFETYLSELEKG